MNSPSTSTTSLLPTSKYSSKNYQQAFGNLASSFGFAGSVVSAPTVSSNKNTSQRVGETALSAGKQNSRTAAQQSQAAYWASQSQKNFEAAYGSLASTYGPNGGAPSPKARKV
ncbi:hypothetical protein AN958_03635 [Leucoagaricus sp. SymC.cos]|nr:hypothetical protein AN958_03635 [Leucoagaricus sp. SymC.cos]